jgi:hypothetical protein
MPTLNANSSAIDGSRPRAVSRTSSGLALVGLATAVLALTGCDPPWSSTPAADKPELKTSELTEANGRPCPTELPTGEDPSGHGFGTEEAADQLPNLLEPQKAWVCQYSTFDAGTTEAGAVYGWKRDGQPEPVAADKIADLRDALDNLTPADRSGGCSSDLGPRWMVVYSHDGDLTGVVVDDYGCHDVRLTDDPRTTPPGADNQDGTVGGVLDGGPAILDALGIGRTN